MAGFEPVPTVIIMSRVTFRHLATKREARTSTRWQRSTKIQQNQSNPTTFPGPLLDNHDGLHREQDLPGPF